MPITPDSSKRLAQEVADLYFQAELSLFKALKTRLKGAKDYADYLEKYKEIKELRRSINKIVLKLGDDTAPTVEKIIKQAYKNGTAQVEVEAALIKNIKITSALSVIDQAKIEALGKALINQLEQGHPQILRISEDIFRKVISESVRDMTMGTATRQMAVQAALNKFADSGIQAFVDKAGRRWTLSAYSEMATRSGLVQANLSGTMDRMADLDQDLVIVSEHPLECELCRPFENKVLSLSGNSTKYMSLQDARDQGLFHPNCSHSTSIYLEGYTDTPAKPTREERAAAQDIFEKRQRLNQMYSTQKKWQRRQAAALSDDEENNAANKLTLWDREIREYKKKHSLEEF